MHGSRRWYARSRGTTARGHATNCMDHKTIITGVGVTTAIGQGKAAFLAALLDGRNAFRVMGRVGRQKDSAFLGAEIQSLLQPEMISPRLLRSASFSGQVALATLCEAWQDACLDAVDSRTIGLIVGGSNFQQRDLTLVREQYHGRESFLRPTYGLSFMDTDVCGLCTAQFGIRGPSYCVGGASASGQLAVIQAVHAVCSGQVDACIALGPLMDLSYWECFGLRSLGAMGSDRYASDPARASRPFDRDSDGFIFGESCAAIVVERPDGPRRDGVRPYAAIDGWSVFMDGNRNPNPSVEGEIEVIRGALAGARCAAQDIDYINPHGTGSPLGDETELCALRECGLAAAYINTTKSITGHGLCAAGAVEVAATVLQMRGGELHPSRNLQEPIDPAFNWVRGERVQHTIRNALTLSMGFGGINTALCLRRLE
jgi:malonyl-ACP decarboxylase